ncbi:MAG: hypothetical protein ACXWTL_11580 [Methylobacter sp.]
MEHDKLHPNQKARTQIDQMIQDKKGLKDEPLPFVYQATNHKIPFLGQHDQQPSQYLFRFHQPEILKQWLEQGDTLTASQITALNAMALSPL